MKKQVEKLLMIILAFMFCVNFAFATKSGSTIVYGTHGTLKSERRYHLAGCTEIGSNARRMTLEEAVQKEYKACEVCHPGYWDGIPMDQLNSEKLDVSSAQAYQEIIISLILSVSVSTIVSIVVSTFSVRVLLRKTLNSNFSNHKRIDISPPVSNKQ